MAHYLVTGGAGFIGTNLVRQLLAEGHSVRVIDNYAGGKKENRIQPGVEYVEGDIRDRKKLDEVMVGIDGVFHLAALPRVTYSVENPDLTHDVNVNGTLNVLLAARDAGVKRVVFSSSSSTYGDQPREAYPLVEDKLMKMPIAPYALHKLIGEHYCRIFSSLYQIETVSLIYFNVYGPFCDPNGAYALVIGKFLQQRSEGKPMTVCGDGEYYRDYTHVSDVARANILAMTRDTVGKGETINIGNNAPHSVNDLVKLIGGEATFVDPRPGDVRYTAANISKAKELLGWEPTVTLEDGIVELKKVGDLGLKIERVEDLGSGSLVKQKNKRGLHVCSFVFYASLRGAHTTIVGKRRGNLSALREPAYRQSLTGKGSRGKVIYSLASYMGL